MGISSSSSAGDFVRPRAFFTGCHAELSALGRGILEQMMSFRTKTEELAHCKAMLARYRDGDTINEQDSQYLMSLLQRHPEARDKIGCGVKRFYRDRTSKGTSCFWLERVDGKPTEFSYKSCVNGKGKTLEQEFAEACREAVQPDLDAAKKAHFAEHGNADGKVPCEETGELVAIYESHLDHKGPMTFDVIVKTFIASHKVTITHGMLSVPADAQFVTTFVDEEIRQQFRDYHHSVCKLRIVAAKANLSLGGSERLRKPKRPVVL
jgi:hypothetical protein